MEGKSDSRNNCETFISEDNRNLSESFDEAFSTLSLVNASDMDVFMKAIMLMDEKEAQSLRGELNHVLCKHLDSNAKLRQGIIDNKYENFDIDYVEEIYFRIGNAKMAAYKRSIKKSLIEIIDFCKTFDEFIQIMQAYAKGAQKLLSDNITPGTSTIDFMNKCCRRSKASIKPLINIHSTIYKIYSMGRANASRDDIVDSCHIGPGYNINSELVSIGIDFYTEFATSNVSIKIELSELNQTIVDCIIDKYEKKKKQ